MTRKKKVAAILAALALVMGLGPSALAASEIDPAAEGTVLLTVADEDDHRADLAESTVTVSVYKVASVDANGLFTLEERFASLAENEQWNGGRLTGNTRAQDLLDGAMAVISPAPAQDAEAPGEPVLLDPDAEAEAQVVDGQMKLGVGLYVLLPQEVQTERWVYSFNPVLLAVPSTQDGAFTYDLPVSMKAEREPRLTEIAIDKTLARYNATLGPTTFLFDVEAVKDGENVYSNVVSLTFSGAGTQSVTVAGIPVGSHVTVTEVYSGASYAVAGGRASVEIEELPLSEGENVTRVPFTNDYDDHRIPDDSVVNTFAFNGTGWQWQSSEEVVQ